MQRERGFTLIELLIVVAIIGVLAAIAIPNLIAAMNRAKQKRTMADMRNIAAAWEARSVETGRYSASGIQLCCTSTIATTEVDDLLVPTFIKSLNHLDGWDVEWEFATNADGSAYIIRSYGRGGAPDSDITGGGTQRFDCDIVYSNGSFVQYPEGLQNQ